MHLQMLQILLVLVSQEAKSVLAMNIRPLTANGRQQMVVTNRVGRNFTYRMQFQFQGDRDIAEGEYSGSIRYVLWQR